VAEWFKAPVLKTGRGRELPREFESHPFRQTSRLNNGLGHDRSIYPRIYLQRATLVSDRPWKPLLAYYDSRSKEVGRSVSVLSHWRQRLGDKLELPTGRETAGGASEWRAAPKDLARITVDTTVQPKAITFPTDAKLRHAAVKGLNRLARKQGVAAATGLSAHRQAGGDDGGALRPRQAVQPPSSAVTHSADAAGPHHPRHRPQGRRSG
jgi:hypothetical protein